MKNTESLKKNNEFRKLFTKGKWTRGKYTVVYLLKNKIEINRLGIATGKKAGNSVQRNRIKRLIRECYRLNEKKIASGYDIVILWKGSNLDISYLELEKDIMNIFEKSGIKNNV